MASTYTPLGVELMATGENAGTWGTKTNANLNLVSQLTGGFAQVSIAGGAGTTALDVDDGALTGTAQQRMIEFTGSITGNRIVTIPNDVETFYILRNSTSGAYTVQFKYATGSGSTFTFSATDKGDKILFASASPDATNPNILTLAIGTGISDVVDDTSPQLGGNLDTNSFNIAFDDAHGIIDENGNEQLIFQTTASAVNQFDMTNAATGNSPSISATGGDTNIDVAIIPKGSGETKIGTGAAAATLTSSGAHDLTLDTNSGTNSGTITITDGANGDITLTPNGTGDVVASADTVKVGDSGAAAVLTSNGAGTLTVTTGGATDLILNTNSGTNSGVIKITDGSNGNIDLTTNGTGFIKFNDAAYNPEATLTDGSTISWDAQAGPVAKVTLAGNRTISAATNGVAGQFVSLLVIQDGTGSRTLTWNAAYEFASDTAPTLTTTANLGDLFVFRYNGSKWLEVGRNLALTLS
jgi:hypothetical protein